MRLEFKYWLVILAVTSGFLLTPTHAEDEDLLLPPERVENEVRFRSGGIGQGERKVLRAQEKHYNLAATFVDKQSGDILPEVNISIQTQGHRQLLVETVTEGPIFLAQLPKGRYVLRAALGGKAAVRVIDTAHMAHTQFIMAVDNPDHGSQTPK